MFVAALLTITIAAFAQDTPPSKLFEAGKYQEAIDRIREQGEAPKDQIYVRALAHRKLNQNDEARAVFNSLAAGEEGAWKSIGASGLALVDGNIDEADAAARKAVEQDGNSAQAHFQLGLVESARGNPSAAAAAFARATELDPQMAYAHYEAGMAFYKSKMVDRMAVYFENFLKLAPDAPEVPAVSSIMRTVRGR